MDFQASIPWRRKISDQRPLRNPDLKCKHAKIDQHREEFRGVMNLPVVDGMRMRDPEERILPTQPFKTPVHNNAQNVKSGKQDRRQRKPAQEHDNEM
jgi:hypothetical protein